jgi:hypothetical protein
MSNINGANNHHVEDLLANIRSSFGNDGNTARAMRPSMSPGNVGPLRGAGSPASDGANEFDLPAIFKPGHQQSSSDRPNLFGRLSDALKSPGHAADTDRSRTVIRFEPAGGRMIEPPRAEEPVFPGSGAFPSVAPEAPIQETVAVRREMPSFFDTRLKGLGQSPKPPAPPPQANLPVVQSRPPALPMDGGSGFSHGAVEDAAAQMLRPILRQWLTENMPKIVEKALRSEMGPDGQPLPPVS